MHPKTREKIWLTVLGWLAAMSYNAAARRRTRPYRVPPPLAFGGATRSIGHLTGRSRSGGDLSDRLGRHALRLHR